VDSDLDTDVQNGIVHAIGVIGYKCHVCKKASTDSDTELRSTVVQQALQIKEIMASITELQSGCIKPPIDSSQTDRSVADKVFTRVINEFRQKDRHQCNVVVSGMSERGSANGDASQFINFCRRYMNVVPDCDESKTRRIDAKNSQGNGPRKLIIVLSSEATRSAILMRAPLLRNIVDDNIKNTIFINPDFTKAEADAAYHRRQGAKEQKRTGVFLFHSLIKRQTEV